MVAPATKVCRRGGGRNAGAKMARTVVRRAATRRKVHPRSRRGPSRSKAIRARREYDAERDRNQKIATHLPLVRQVVQQLQGALPASIEYDEVMSWGVDGLLDALTKFDPTKATQFQTYARIRIRGAILDQLRSLDWVSRTARQKANHLMRSSQRLEHHLGRQASHEELAKEMGLTVEELHDLITEVGDLAMVSLDDHPGDV